MSLDSRSRTVRFARICIQRGDDLGDFRSDLSQVRVDDQVAVGADDHTLGPELGRL